MAETSIEVGGINIGTKTADPQQRPKSPATIFQALIMANFSGHQSPAILLKPKQVDRDNFDSLLENINPTLNLQITDQHHIEIAFSTLEDFEPDSLFNKLDVFSELRSLRRRLSNQATFMEAAMEMGAKQKDSPATTETANISATDLLSATLSETSDRSQDYSRDEDLVKNIIHDIVAPYIIPKADPQQAELIHSVDQSISGLMNNILHHADFQALESAWRGLYFVIKRVETSSNLKIFLLDISKSQLMENTQAADISQSAFFKSLVEPYCMVPGATPWSIWIGDYTISDDTQDILLMGRMGKLAEFANITFVSSASPQLVSCDDLAITPEPEDWNIERDRKALAAWLLIRESSEARHLALTFPRVLMRLPYGNKTRGIENFNYEEMQGSEHRNYLWGSAGYGVLTLLAQSYTVNKWQFKPGSINELTQMPLHFYEEDGETEQKPCAEILMTERSAEIIKQYGIIPVWSVKNSDAVRIGPIVSLFQQSQLIIGNWVSG